MKKVPSVDTIVDKANLDVKPSEVFKGLSQIDVYDYINRYYEEYTDINTIEYKFYDRNTDNLEYHIKTTLYNPDNIRKINTENIQSSDIYYSNYTERGLKKAELDKKDIWNGDSVIAILDEQNNINIGQTDYYTSMIFSRLVHAEAASAFKNNEKTTPNPNNLSLRHSMLRTKEQFEKTPVMSTGISSGGLIIGKSDDSWEFLLGKRSQSPLINPGLESVIPNGSVESSDFGEQKLFYKALQREFKEELLENKSDGDQFFNKFVDVNREIVGWNIRDGSLAVGYSLFIKNSDKYRELKNNTDSTNFEFSELKNYSIKEIEDLIETIDSGKISPSVIPYISRVLMRFNNSDKLPNIRYKIEELTV